MVESLLVCLGAVGSLLLAIYIVHLRQCWLYTFGALVFGLIAVAEFRPSGVSSVSAVLLSGAAIVTGRMLLRSAWMTTAATAIMFGSIARAVTDALHGGIEAPVKAALPLQVSGTGATCLFGLVLLAAGARKSSALVRAIQQARDVNRRLWDCSTSGIVMVDASYRVIEWNPAMERLTGLRRAQVAGTVLTSVPGFHEHRHEESLRLAAAGIEIASDAITGAFAAECRLSGYYSPLFDEDGNVTGVLVMVAPAARRMAATTRTILSKVAESAA